MRGKDADEIASMLRKRITPAYAGKSSIVSPSSAVDWDHPRLCGEKDSPLAYRSSRRGSPPPMRGKVKEHFTGAYNARITPAYAGKSVVKSVFLAEFKDHPRLCGEKTKKIPKQRYFFHQPASFSFSLQYT